MTGARLTSTIYTAAVALLLGFFVAVPRADALGLALRFGPPAVGQGGPNPVSIPPQSYDTELSAVTQRGFEMNFSVTGVLLGYRQQFKWGGYVSLGGGGALDGNGAGLGVYSSFGADVFCGFNHTLCFSAEYMRVFAISAVGPLLPYAARIGFSLWL